MAGTTLNSIYTESQVYVYENKDPRLLCNEKGGGSLSIDTLRIFKRGITAWTDHH